MKPKLLVLLLLINAVIYAQSINTILEGAGRDLIKQNYYQAIEGYKQALLINDNDIRANRGLSDAFYHIGEFDEALIYINRCLNLDRENIEYKNLKARIYTALEQYEEAEELYTQVLEMEMYNVAAKSGIAELRLISGDLSGSLYDFEQILEFSPGSRRLLLSLVVLYDNQKMFQQADEIIQRAIRMYPSDPIVLQSAVRHYMNTASYRGASIYMGELLALTDSIDVLMLNAELLLRLEEYDEALNSLNLFMKKDKENSYAYYLAALLLELKGDRSRALSLVNRGLDIKPDEELYRFYREMLVKDLFLLKDEKREEYASWYLDQGQVLEDRYYYDKARNYYLRGLDLAPFSQDIRLAYAEILKKTGYKQRYLKELSVIIEQSPDRADLQEIIDIESSITPLDIYQVWGEEIFDPDEKLSLSIFVNNQSIENHIESSKIIRSISERFLTGKRRYSIDSTGMFGGDFSAAFAQAREHGTDYFVLLEYFEGSRTFSLKGELYLTRSGRKMHEFNYLKTGNSRIFNCFENFAKDLEYNLPVIGTVKDIKNRDVLINLGKYDGIDVEDEFHVVKRGSFKLIPDLPLISYPKQKDLGRLTIKSVGEMISSGEFIANSTFNLLNIGDEVLLIDETENSDEPVSNSSIVDKELIDQLLRVN